MLKPAEVILQHRHTNIDLDSMCLSGTFSLEPTSFLEEIHLCHLLFHFHSFSKTPQRNGSEIVGINMLWSGERAGLGGEGLGLMFAFMCDSIIRD